MIQDKAKAADLRLISSLFRTNGSFKHGETIPSGHINETYRVTFETSQSTPRYILQKINTHVFRTPEKLMENIFRVTSHARKKIEASGGDPRREVLNLVPATDGKWFARTPDGGFWRMYDCIEAAKTYDKPESSDQVFAAARAFGRFQKTLADLPGGRLHETIPGFHDTRRRFQAFLQALESDGHNRAAAVKTEIDFALNRENQAGLILDLMASREIPERITHNDTKLNNVMFDSRSGEGICVIDLDTVMPGSALYDFGDSVRLGAATAAEDERDLDKVDFDIGLYDRLIAGYLNTAGDFLLPSEIENLAFSARLMTFECGLRFLTDYLEGDAYFRIHRPGQNIDRCRTQFKMISRMEKLEKEMTAVVSKYVSI